MPDRPDVYPLDSPDPATERRDGPGRSWIDGAREQWRGTPLRVRLVAMLVALALVALAVTAAVAVALLQGELVAKVDAQVTAVARGVTGDGPLSGLGNPQDRENQLPSSQYAVVVLDSGLQVRIGRQLDDSSPVPDVSGITPAVVAQHDGAPFTVGATRGGDDYVTKPFSLEEVVARIRAVLRRTGRSNGVDDHSRLVFGDLELDEDSHDVHRGGRLIELSPTEFKLLRYLMLNPNRVLSKAQILDHVWEYDFRGESGIVESYISYLRRKVDADSTVPLIHTRRGVGYVLRLPPEQRVAP
jgi:DNA-binding response OmpR family regulator